MKAKRILALVLALVLALGLAGCSRSGPANVGKIGEEEISSGLYLILQLNAYSDAASHVNADEDPLTASITVDGQEMTGSDYVVQRTNELLADFVATHALFAQLGGELTTDDQMFIENYTNDMWSTGSDLYEANGIGAASLQAYVEYTVQRQTLLSLLYGPKGSQPVEDEAVRSYINDNYRKASYIGFPLLNFNTYTALDEAGDKAVRELAQAAAERIQTGEDLAVIAGDLLPESFALLGLEYDESAVANSLGNAVFTPAQIASYGAPATEQLLAAQPGDVLVVDISDSRMAMVMEPVLAGGTTLELLRESALYEMKGDDLTGLLLETGNAMDWQLDSSALNRYSPKNIKAA